MMTSQQLIDYVKAEPFRPFLLKMASGQTFNVRHPEMILVGRSSVRVHTATDSDQNEKWHDISLMLMESIEPMEPALKQ